MNPTFRPSACIAGLLLLIVGTFVLFHPPELLAAHQGVSFKTTDGGRIYGNLDGTGDHAVVLAHGAIFDKESWRSQAISMSAAGLSVLAIDFRGYGKSVSGTAGRALHLDILAAMEYLKAQGKKRVSLVGGSMGGSAVAEAVIAAKPGSVDRVILLAAGSVDEPAKLHG